MPRRAIGAGYHRRAPLDQKKNDMTRIVPILPFVLLAVLFLGAGIYCVMKPHRVVNWFRCGVLDGKKEQVKIRRKAKKEQLAPSGCSWIRSVVVGAVR